MSKPIILPPLYKPSGTVNIPPSKSIMHRELIRLFLTDNLPTITPECLDVEKTYNILKHPDAERFDVGESGTTLRLLLPVFAALGTTATFVGAKSLFARPLTPLLQVLGANGVKYTLTEQSITISGQLQPNIYELPGNISSQYISGLLLANLVMQGQATIKLTTKLESQYYVQLTEDAMQRYYDKAPLYTEGDYSAAAFFIIANKLGANFTIRGLNPNSNQGDKSILNLNENWTDATDIPDLVPPIAAYYALTPGEHKITGAKRLKIKESNRLQTITNALNNIGADVNLCGDDLIINGQDYINGGKSDSFNDHRIAMMLAICSLKSKQEIIINHPEVVKKSYISFWRDFGTIVL